MNPLLLRAGIALGALTTAGNVLPAQGGGSPPAETRAEDYAFYTPGACASAASRRQAFLFGLPRDTIPLAGDTLPAAAVQVARTCVARFKVDEVLPRDLILLARGYLAAGDDAAAKAAVTRRLSADAAKAPAARAMTLAEIVKAYIQANPARVTEARQYLRQLDALRGGDVPIAQIDAHVAMMEHFRHVADDSGTVVEAKAVLAVKRALPRGERCGGTPIGMYRVSIMEAYTQPMLIEGARTASAAAARASMPQAMADTDLGVYRGSLSEPDSLLGLYGQKGSRLVGAAWVGAVGDTVFPAPGKLTVIRFDPRIELAIPAFRRLAAEFGDDLKLVSVHATQGYFGETSRGHYHMKGPLTPAEEATLVEQHYVRELGLPGAVMITKTTFDTLPDGRLVPAALDPNRKAYHRATLVVLDRQGVVRFLFEGSGDLMATQEKRIAEMLRRLR